MKWLNKQPDYDLTYNDVFLVPSLTDVASRTEVDLTTTDGIGTTVPIVVANMNAVSGKRMAESVARRGGIAVIPQDMPKQKLEKIINYVKSRHTVYETAVALNKDEHLNKALALMQKRSHGTVVVVDEANKPIGIFTEKDAADWDRFADLEQAMSTDVITVQDSMTQTEMFEKLETERLELAPVVDKSGVLLGIVSKKGLVRSSVFKPNVDTKGRLKVAAAVGINGDVAAKVQQLLDLEVDIIVLDTAHGHQTKMIEAVKTARKAAPKATLVAGNVVTVQATRDLIAAGADIIKVGVGPGAMCTTRMMTGVGRPQFSAVYECATEARKLGKKVWADGGVKHPRDVALALAAGADNVMFASWLAATYESAADMQIDEQGRLYKENYGMASKKAVALRNRNQSAFDRYKKAFFEEGISASKLYIDPRTPSVEDIIDQISAGVRSSCTYAGARNLTEFFDKAVVGVQSAAGFSEGMAHTSSWS